MSSQDKNAKNEQEKKEKIDRVITEIHSLEEILRASFDLSVTRRSSKGDIEAAGTDLARWADVTLLNKQAQIRKEADKKTLSDFSNGLKKVLDAQLKPKIATDDETQRFTQYMETTEESIKEGESQRDVQGRPQITERTEPKSEVLLKENPLLEIADRNPAFKKYIVQWHEAYKARPTEIDRINFLIDKSRELSDRIDALEIQIASKDLSTPELKTQINEFLKLKSEFDIEINIRQKAFDASITSELEKRAPLGKLRSRSTPLEIFQYVISENLRLRHIKDLKTRDLQLRSYLEEHPDVLNYLNDNLKSLKTVQKHFVESGLFKEKKLEVPKKRPTKTSDSWLKSKEELLKQYQQQKQDLKKLYDSMDPKEDPKERQKKQKIKSKLFQMDGIIEDLKMSIERTKAETQEAYFKSEGFWYFEDAKKSQEYIANNDIVGYINFINEKEKQSNLIDELQLFLIKFDGNQKDLENINLKKAEDKYNTELKALKEELLMEKEKLTQKYVEFQFKILDSDNQMSALDKRKFNEFLIDADDPGSIEFVKDLDKRFTMHISNFLLEFSDAIHQGELELQDLILKEAKLNQQLKHLKNQNAHYNSEEKLVNELSKKIDNLKKEMLDQKANWMSMTSKLSKDPDIQAFWPDGDEKDYDRITMVYKSTNSTATIPNFNEFSDRIDKNFKELKNLLQNKTRARAPSPVTFLKPTEPPPPKSTDVVPKPPSPSNFR